MAHVFFKLVSAGLFFVYFHSFHNAEGMPNNISLLFCYTLPRYSMC